MFLNPAPRERWDFPYQSSGHIVYKVCQYMDREFLVTRKSNISKSTANTEKILHRYVCSVGHNVLAWQRTIQEHTYWRHVDGLGRWMIWLSFVILLKIHYVNDVYIIYRMWPNFNENKKICSPAFAIYRSFWLIIRIFHSQTKTNYRTSERKKLHGKNSKWIFYLCIEKKHLRRLAHFVRVFCIFSPMNKISERVKAGIGIYMLLVCLE